MLSLNGKWKVTHVPYCSPIDFILSPSFVPEGWLDAAVPEEIHRTLRNAGIIRGNVYGKTEEEELWIEQADWVYHKEFFVPAEETGRQVLLTFEGLDTFCDIYLNGILTGSHKNMHIPFQTDVKDLLHFGGRNVLVVRFYSPVRYVENRDDSEIFSITTSDRIFARKAQMNYSWDFCGRCVTVGIWKNVSLTAVDSVRISSHYLYTKLLEEDSALLHLNIDFSTPDYDTFSSYYVSVNIEKDGNPVCHISERAADCSVLEFSLEDPILWWPRPYGEPFLYDFVLRLEKEGQILQEIRQKFGIRRIAVLQEPVEDGLSFQFAVNGRRLFIRGANWVPLNTIYTDITDEDYEKAVRYACEGNLTMLRIWGGGIYESPRFFELCDEKGILVWNDFMFACGIYPRDEEFLENVALEAETVIKKYRNYTSLALWAGDNENGQAYGWAGRPYEFAEDPISCRILKKACETFDPNRFYLTTSPGSPCGDLKGGDNPESPYQGDSHLYIMSADPGIRSGRDYGRNYYKRILSYRPRFMSEFGFICFPEKDTFYRYNFRRLPLSRENELTEFLPFTGEFMEKNDFDSAIYYSQVYNSMALKYWIEYFRSLKGICSGTLYWKFNDPAADCAKGGIFPSHMSVIDMFGQPKMTYYYTRRAYEDFLVCCTEKKDAFRIHACSELTEEIKGTLHITHMDFKGKVILEKSMACTAAADSTTLLAEFPGCTFAVKDKYEEYFRIRLDTSGCEYENRYFFADICEINRLKLPPAGLRIRKASFEDGNIRLYLYTENFARSVRLRLSDRPAGFADNYFDMDADSEKIVCVIPDDKDGLEAAALIIDGINVSSILLPLASLLSV